MNLTGGIVLYAVIWFLVLFVLAPIGQRSQADVGEVTPGTPAGAPHNPPLKRMAIMATIITTVLWGAIAWIILDDIVTRADLVRLFG
ncbi:DUF1467 family protein [Paracoccus aminophilus]|uniref:Uncharacterized protein n=1 Tax=Paracoccus aminophilus JCM 7686 TaxID=1367847 RepID=S5Y1D3_PARAH|nr:DUF1467 family protein [Paracoccus aminophilus]AGT09505.1 hypothetical protein JCM7686_2437 [Paracoccus aminophilus JCM 7686]